VARLESQPAIVIAVLSTRAAAVVRHMIGERFYIISGPHNLHNVSPSMVNQYLLFHTISGPAQFATTFRRGL
jgi:hypothetical protein